jgi:hypothetical protein
MNNELKTFKTLILTFLIILIILLYINYLTVKDIWLRKSISTASSQVYEIKVEKYGYSDIFDLIFRDENLEVNSISNSSGTDELIKVNIGYRGKLEDLYSTLNSISKEKFFYMTENLIIEKYDDMQQSISLTLVFTKNK